MVTYQAAIFAQEESAGNGEPEWMPGPAEVERARRELERKGVTRGLKRGMQGAPAAPAGEPPWLWLLGAAAWVIAWPAVLALSIGEGWWPWLPLWLPIVLAALHMLLLIIPVLRSIRRSSYSAVRRQFGRVQTLSHMFALEPDEFETWVGMLFTLRGFEVENTQYVADHGIDLVVRGEGIGRGLVQCKRYRGTVGEPIVRELYGTHVHENADYSWLATTGAVSRRAREWAAGKPIELWDGQRLMELARKYW